MPENYNYTAEMPEISIENNGIIKIDFGTILITPNHIIHSVEIHRKLAPNKKSPVLMIGEAALNLSGEISKVGAREETVNITSALALVTKSKIAKVLGNIFINLHQNPYPTKLFENENDARAWLKNYRA